jgi:hypothetical protein
MSKGRQLSLWALALPVMMFAVTPAFAQQTPITKIVPCDPGIVLTGTIEYPKPAGDTSDDFTVGAVRNCVDIKFLQPPDGPTLTKEPN